MKYEYLVEYITRINQGKRLKRLDELGGKGWRLVAVDDGAYVFMTDQSPPPESSAQAAGELAEAHQQSIRDRAQSFGDHAISSWMPRDSFLAGHAAATRGLVGKLGTVEKALKEAIRLCELGCVEGEMREDSLGDRSREALATLTPLIGEMKK